MSSWRTRFQLIVFLIIFVFGFFSGQKISIFTCGISIFYAIGLILALQLASFVAIAIISKMVGKGVAEKDRDAIKLLLSAKLGKFVPIVIVACAVVEEIAFRGIVNAHTGCLIGSLIFALIHVPNSVCAFASLFLGGLTYSYEAFLTGGLIVPLVHHVGLNLLVTFVTMFAGSIQDSLPRLKLEKPELVASWRTKFPGLIEKFESELEKNGSDETVVV